MKYNRGLFIGFSRCDSKLNATSRKTKSNTLIWQQHVDVCHGSEVDVKLNHYRGPKIDLYITHR